MGLCKCPQRKVSTLFCFQHHVNVCESCLVSDHSQCIIRSYLSWLQDNDYDPNCAFCHKSLTDNSQETIRLMCYDVFHWSCLREYFRTFPLNTAPDGYTCPICNAIIFPASNHASPVAEQLRAKLATVDWATRLPLSMSDGASIPMEKSILSNDHEKNGFVFVNGPTAGHTVVETSGLSHHPNRSNDSIPESTTIRLNQTSLDTDDDDKYKRRSVFTWFARWLRSRQPSNRRHGNSSNRETMSPTRFRIYVTLIVIFVFLTVLVVLYHVTRGDSGFYDSLAIDPQFNPINNPFVNVDKGEIKNPV